MSWDQLRAIYADNARRREDELAQPPEACPYDGEPLVAHPVTGVLNCPDGDYQWP